MDSGMYTSAISMLDQFNTENSISDNLSNLQTPGYKTRTPVLESFSQTLLSSAQGLDTGTNSTVIGQFATAPQIHNYGLDLGQGTPRSTGAPLDTMIVGNAFFTVRSGSQTLLTRNGSFQRGANGLLMTASGYPVLSNAASPIHIPQGTISIDRAGAISVNGKPVAQLGLARVPVGKPLTEAGSGYYHGPGIPLPPRTAGLAVLQGYLETSNVDMSTQTTAMVAAQRAYQESSRMLQIEDDTMGLAVNELGKVGA